MARGCKAKGCGFVRDMGWNALDARKWDQVLKRISGGALGEMVAGRSVLCAGGFTRRLRCVPQNVAYARAGFDETCSCPSKWGPEVRCSRSCFSRRQREGPIGM